MVQRVTESSKSRIRRENLRRIIEAAELAFAEHGFAGTTMMEIAQRASLPKANVHYYFGTKDELYRAVLADIIAEWSASLGCLSAASDPGPAINAYIRQKLEFSRRRPHASRLFAGEIIRGGSQLTASTADAIRAVVADKAAVIEGWAASGRVAPVDGRHFIIMLWAMTQHYADFDVQVRTVFGKSSLTDDDWDHILDQVKTYALRILGLDGAV